MIKSKYFWLGTILLALAAMVLMDIPKHYMDWTREVHDRTIETVFNQYHLSEKEKGPVIQEILDSNKTLMANMYLKGFAGAAFIFLSIYFFVQYRKQGFTTFWKPFGVAAFLLACSIGLKAYSWYSFTGSDKIKLLAHSPMDTSLINIYNANFKGKVVYVDFWGTTCGPCLNEFRTFTKPLKAKYHDRQDLAYLYICGGHEMVWRQQLQKFDVAGMHLFLGEPAYSKLFSKSIRGSKDTLIAMPRYLIIDKHGKIVETDAPRPSDKDSISAKLDKYLAEK